MAPLKPTGFWSYTSADDVASDGRLSRLRTQLANRLRQQLGRQVHLFQDVAAIPPGTLWEQQIESALAEASFFIPILTPGFLQSEWCTKEVREFRTHMEARGRDDLIMPVHYLDVLGFATLRRGDCFDPAVFEYLRSLQWVDFRALEPLDSNVTEVRVWLAGFARRIEEALWREVPPQAEPKLVLAVGEPVPSAGGAELAPPADRSAPGTASSPPCVRTESAPPVVELSRSPAPTAGPEVSTDRPTPEMGSSPPPVRSEQVAGWKKPVLGVAAGVAVLVIGYLIIPNGTPSPDSVHLAAIPTEPAPAPPDAPSPAPVPPPAPAEELRDICPANAMCPEMVLIPHGTFQMGTTDEELAREKVPGSFRSSEKPRHPVSIGAEFYMGKYTVTVGEFRAFVRAKGARPSGGCSNWEKGGDGNYGWQLKADRGWESPGFSQTEHDPVVCISHDDAAAYVQWLNEVTPGDGGLAKALGRGPYHLPSEAEWEYSARAGTTTARFWGDRHDNPDPACRFANVADASLAKQGIFGPPGPENYFSCDDHFAFTSPVGTYQPNGFGLYDMLGNVWQWTGDCWNEDYNYAPADGSARTTTDCSRHVLRGGSWGNYPWSLRAGSRIWHSTGYRLTNTGLRVARTN